MRTIVNNPIRLAVASLLGSAAILFSSISPAALVVDVDFDGGTLGAGFASAASAGTMPGVTVTPAAGGGTNVIYTSGRVAASDSAVLLNGASADYLNVNNFTGYGTDWTVMFSMRLDSAHVVNGRYLQGAGGPVVTNRLASGDQVDVLNEINTTVAFGPWVHIAYTYDDDGSPVNPGRSVWRLYIDGVEVDSNNNRPEHTSPGSPGTLDFGGRAFAAAIDGALDDFRIFDTELTAGEVLAEYELTVIPEPASAILLGLFGLLALRRR